MNIEKIILTNDNNNCTTEIYEQKIWTKKNRYIKRNLQLRKSLKAFALPLPRVKIVSVKSVFCSFMARHILLYIRICYGYVCDTDGYPVDWTCFWPCAHDERKRLLMHAKYLYGGATGVAQWKKATVLTWFERMRKQQLQHYNMRSVHKAKSSKNK